MNLNNEALSRRGRLILLLACLFLITTSALAASGWAWSNGGYSSDPANPDYGTHDWIAQHALEWLPTEEKQYIIDNLASYLYGTELPDNNRAAEGIHDTTKHHIYYNSDEVMTDDAAAARASTEYNNALNFLKAKDYTKAAKNAGTMSHYIVDMVVFGHLMGTGTDWGKEIHHTTDYEPEVNDRTESYSDSEFNSYLSFDGSLIALSAYDAAANLAYDTTFDAEGKLTCTWMDQNYNWSNPIFKDRVGESLNLAANYLTDVLHTLYQESLVADPPVAEAAIAATVVTASGVGTAYAIRKRKKTKKHLNTMLNNTTVVGKMERKPKPWEQQKSIERETTERTYRCPTCKAIVLSVPYNWSVPPERVEALCPNGHKVKVPKFPQFK